MYNKGDRVVVIIDNGIVIDTIKDAYEVSTKFDIDHYYILTDNNYLVSDEDIIGLARKDLKIDKSYSKELIRDLIDSLDTTVIIRIFNIVSNLEGYKYKIEDINHIHGTILKNDYDDLCEYILKDNRVEPNYVNNIIVESIMKSNYYTSRDKYIWLEFNLDDDMYKIISFNSVYYITDDYNVKNLLVDYVYNNQNKFRSWLEEYKLKKI